MVKLSAKHKIVCIGGGHGLGRLLSSLADDSIDLTGIVATTDNGGSTGRIRSVADTIAWGDLRYCLSQMASGSRLEHLLLDYRFENKGDLQGHSLGNLMLLALDDLCVSPTESIAVMSRFLGIKSQLLPMSDMSTHLMATDFIGDVVKGEVEIANMKQFPIKKLWLKPEVSTSQAVIKALKSADLILLGPGSFITSVLPPLLISTLVNAINSCEGQLVWLANLKPENSLAADSLDLKQKLNLIKSTGLNKIDAIIWPKSLVIPKGAPEYLSLHELEIDKDGLHSKECLKKAIMAFVANHK